MAAIYLSSKFFLYIYILIDFAECTKCQLLSKKNVLLIVIPEMRSVLISSSKKKIITPNIDMLSTESIIFHNVFAQQASSAPSRISLLTSRRPDTLHLYGDTSYWREFAGNFTTLPEYFKANGYDTVSVGDVFQSGISSNFNDDSPYSWSTEPYHPYTEKFEGYPLCLFLNGSDLLFVSNLVCPIVPRIQPCKTLPDIEIMYEAKNCIRNARRNKNSFFLAVGFKKPKVPLKYPIAFLSYYTLNGIKTPVNRIRPSLMPPVAWNPWNHLRDFCDIKSLNLSYPYGVIPENYTQLILQNYYASLTYVDDLIGELLRELILNKLYENTIIAIVGTHGSSLGENGLWGGFSNYDVAVKVPLLLYTPQVTSSDHMRFRRVSHDLVELVDLFPTLVDLAGLKPLPMCPYDSSNISLCTEGISLLPVIEAFARSSALNQRSYKEWKRAVFSQCPRVGLHPTRDPDTCEPSLENITIMGYAIRTHRFKYVEWVQFKNMKPDWSVLIENELYDFSIDPTESLNLASVPQLDNIMTRLRVKLHSGWKSSLPNFY